MGVGVSYISNLAHAVFQILPADAAAQVLDDNAVVCPRRRAVPVDRTFAVFAMFVIIFVHPTAAGSRGTAGRSMRQLHHNSLSV